MLNIIPKGSKKSEKHKDFKVLILNVKSPFSALSQMSLVVL